MFLFLGKITYELLENIPDLSLWLEFGVSEETQISLLSLGLSRQSSIVLSGQIPNSDFSKKQALDWLLEADLGIYNLSPIILSEIQTVLAKNKIR